MTEVAAKSLSWEDARTQIRKNSNVNRVSDALANEISDMGNDQTVTLEYGTCAWDFAEAVKKLNPDGVNVKGKSVQQLANEFLKQMNLSDPTQVPTGAKLDLNPYLDELDQKTPPRNIPI
ncbi:MAG TPA: hypothetical protein V6C99_03835 [Oculatellaceae cyanobacterium]|jgi:hypothetical protein